MACGMLRCGAPSQGTWAPLMAFPFSSRSFARGGPEAEGRKRFLLSVEWLKMNRKRSNELREQVRATVSFFETAPVFFPVLHSCWSTTLPQLTLDCCQFARRTDALPGKYRYFSGFCFPAASAGINKTFTNSGAAAVPPFLSIRGIANPAGKKPFCLN